MPSGHTAALASMALLFAVASCAPAAPRAAADAGTAAAYIAGAGTVLAVSPVAPAGNGAGDAWRAVLLRGAIAMPDHADPVTAALAEFIVRTDDGAMLSIVQSRDAAIRPGQGVTIARPAAAPGMVTLSLL